ncbi:craniofacial development protein 2-like [Sitophilus oryzae]|uniref:Craniofacial development protein 2-like n=1 Tax=Sitophilus oryzae TaxID=7048 RepID=A0A6J2X4C2_SITOR|nr:craniofacial development protein 2-like [Sitophilus oryzae]
MNRLKVNIFGISEVRWPGSGKCITDGGTFYYSGSDDQQKHPNGVGILVDKETNKAVTGFVPLSERVMMIQLETSKIRTNIIQVYAPTAQSEDREIDEFYGQIEQLWKNIKKHEVTIVMGDFNAKIGRRGVVDVIGEHGLGQRNERGERLVEFVQEKDIVVTNTLFKLPPRRLYTWRSPQDTKDKIVRNQIDYVMINKRYRNSILSAKTYPGADMASDHNPVVATFKLTLKRIRQSKKSTKMDFTRLRNSETRSRVEKRLTEELQTSHSRDKGDINIEWEKIKDTIFEIGNKELSCKNEKKKNEWMTDEIIELMRTRREAKTTENNRYKSIHRDK